MFSKSDKDRTQSNPAGQQARPTQPQPVRAAETAAPGRQNQPGVRPGGNAAPSIISADLKVLGNLESAGDVQVDGTIEGDIHSRTVTVNVGAHIEGSIYADLVEISGSIKGQIKGKTVNIHKSAKVLGDIIHESVSIEAGAHLEGHYRRIDMAQDAIKPVADTAAAAKPAKPADKPADKAAAKA